MFKILIVLCDNCIYALETEKRKEELLRLGNTSLK